MAVISATQGIRDEIAARLNEIESDNTDIYTNWINLGLRDIAYSFPDAPFLQTSANFALTAGTRIYSNLVVSAEKINSVTLPQTQTKLLYLPPEQFDIWAPSASQGGTPTVYTIRGLASNGTWEFYPVPGSSYTVFVMYDKSIGTVSAAADVPAIPTKYFDLLATFGERMGLRRQKQYELSMLVEKDYEIMKQRMKEDLMRMSDQMPRVKSVREFVRAQGPITTDPISQAFFGGGNGF